MYFKIKTYNFSSRKLTAPLKLLVLADLHGRTYPEGEGDLAGMCRERKPDLILVPGDTVTARTDTEIGPTLCLFADLARICPVYLANGNHESKLRAQLDRFGSRYRQLYTGLAKCGVRVLNNAAEDICLSGNALRLVGLEVPLSTYKKGRRPHLSEEGLWKALGPRDPERFNILIAHNPAFARQYFSWGADLAVAGHFHGGIVRSPITRRALMDPYGFPLPKYGYGMYKKGEQRLVVSGGLGDHFLLPRIFNPRELVEIVVEPEKKE